MRPSGERGIVTNYFLKIFFWMAIAGVVLYDGGSIVVNFVTLDGTADDMANELSVPPSQGTDITQRLIDQRAPVLAEEMGVRLLQAEVTPEGALVIKIRRRADTLVVGRIGAIEDWARATAEARTRL